MSCSLNGHHHSQDSVLANFFYLLLRYPHCCHDGTLFTYNIFTKKHFFLLQLVRNVRSREEETDDDDSPFSHRCHRKTFLVTDNSNKAKQHPLPAAVLKLFFYFDQLSSCCSALKNLKHLFSSGLSPRVASQFFSPSREKKRLSACNNHVQFSCLPLYPLFCFVYHHTMTTVSYYWMEAAGRLFYIPPHSPV